MADKETLKFVIDSPPMAEIQGKGMFPMPQIHALSSEIVDLGKDAVRDSIGKALNDVMDILSSIPLKKGLLSVSEVKLTMTLDAQGEISILSIAKGSLTGSTGIQFTIRVGV